MKKENLIISGGLGGSAAPCTALTRHERVGILGNRGAPFGSFRLLPKVAPFGPQSFFYFVPHSHLGGSENQEVVRTTFNFGCTNKNSESNIPQK